MLAGIVFSVVYANTFRDTHIPAWTHGPFGADAGCYLNFAKGFWTIEALGDKVPKHFLCALLYPSIDKLLAVYWENVNSPLVCSFLGGLAVASFGFWLHWRIKSQWIVFPVILIFGFSFATWYVASIWESRAFIALGSVIILISLDRIIRRPTFPSVFLSVLATVFVMLITIEPYLIPLAPFAISTRWKHIGTRKVISLSIFQTASVLLIVASIYQFMSPINPWLGMEKVLGVWQHDSQHVQFSTDRFNYSNFQRVSLVSLLYSVGGFQIPAGARKVLEVGSNRTDWCPYEWVKNIKVYWSYFDTIAGSSFIVAYLILFSICVYIMLKNGLWFKEPILATSAVWFLLYIVFGVYTDPTFGPIYAVELLAPLWASVAVILSHKKPMETKFFFLCLFLAILKWNNGLVMEFFKLYYG